MYTKLFVARDQNGDLFLYTDEPYRGPETKKWYPASDFVSLDNTMFPDVLWSSDPLQVYLTPTHKRAPYVLPKNIIQDHVATEQQITKHLVHFSDSKNNITTLFNLDDISYLQRDSDIKFTIIFRGCTATQVFDSKKQCDEFWKELINSLHKLYG